MRKTSPRSQFFKQAGVLGSWFQTVFKIVKSYILNAVTDNESSKQLRNN